MSDERLLNGPSTGREATRTERLHKPGVRQGLRARTVVDAERAVRIDEGTTRPDEATRRKLRVLFVGMDLSSLSIEVLEAISAMNDFEILPAVSRRPGSIGRAWRDYGWRTVVRGAGMLARARWRMLLRRVGLRRTEGFRSLSELADERGLDLLPFERINAGDTIERFRAFDPDVLLVAACDQILRKPVIELPRLAAVNVHPSLLPAHRGPKPCYWVIANRETSTGVTYHQIDEGIDTGAILAQRRFDVAPGESEPRLRRRCGEVAGAMACEVLHGLRDGTLEPRPQPEEGASYEGKPPRGRSRL